MLLGTEGFIPGLHMKSALFYCITGLDMKSMRTENFRGRKKIVLKFLDYSKIPQNEKVQSGKVKK